MFRTPRVCHVRYGADKKIVDKRDCNDYHRIVTIAWNFHPKENMLVYGATVYTPINHSDKWVKKHHADRARVRYEKNPVMIKFMETVYFSRVAMDRYIADHLVYLFGVKSKVLDYVHHFTCDGNITKKYDPEYHILIRDRVVHGDGHCIDDNEDNGDIDNSRPCSRFWWVGILAIATVWGGIVMG